VDQLVTIEIFGQPFTFKADSNVSKAREVAEYLSKEVSKVEAQLAGKGGTVDKRAILILTALNITYELFEYKKEHQALMGELIERSEGLLQQLDTKLQ
jgi:cell division protein ZapA (FtsZ GTPase activity inhibitor)